MKLILSATLVASTLTFASASTASADSFLPYNSEMSLGQAAKRTFRLGNRGWRLIALSTSIGMSTVQAHADGYTAGETALKIGEDLWDETVQTADDLVYVGQYAAVHGGKAAVSIASSALDFGQRIAPHVGNAAVMIGETAIEGGTAAAGAAVDVGGYVLKQLGNGAVTFINWLAD